MDKYGSWGVFNEYKKLNQLRNEMPDFRVISAGLAPKAIIAPVYSIDTFDGMRANFTWRRSMFFKYVIFKDYIPRMHFSRQFLFDEVSIEDVNFYALNMVNIKYILSSSKINIPFKNNEISESYAGKTLDLGVFGDFNVVPPLIIYKIGDPWDRVFIAREVEISKYNNYEIGYYQSLQKLERHHAIIANNDFGNFDVVNKSGARIISTSKELDGMTIELNGLSGFLVYNQEYNHIWKAICNNDKNLSIYPVNGMMMGVYVPSGCKAIRFLYRFDS
uniref:hypothetical protein n=1 Tax=Polynucleobacter sp. TaxID=2029855 RepID=UPI0040473743